MKRSNTLSIFTRRGLSIIPPLILFFLLALVLSLLWFHDREQNAQNLRELTEVMGEQVGIRLENWINARLTLAHYLALNWKEQYNDNPEKFCLDVSNLLKTYPGLQAVNWIDSTWTIRIINPQSGNEPALNKNLHFHPDSGVTLAIQKAIETKSLTSTPIISLLQGGKGFATYFPVFEKQRLLGFINAVFKVDTLIQYCLNDAYLNQHFSYFIHSKDNKAIYSKGKISAHSKTPSAYLKTVNIRIADRYWKVHISPSETFIKNELAITRNKFFFFNLIFTLIIAYLIWILLLRHRKTRQSEEFFRSLFEAANTWIHILNPEGILVNANETFYQQTGVTENSLIGKNFRDFLTYKSQIIFDSWLKELPDKNRFRSEFEFIIDKTRTRYIDCSGSVIYDFQQKPLYLILHQIDITDKKRFQHALNESEAKYRVIVEHSHDSIFIYRDNRFLFVNKRVSEISEYSIDELYQLPIWDLIHPEDRARLQKYARSRREGKIVPSTYEAKIITKNGDIRYCEFDICPINYLGEYAGLGAVRDITEQKKAQQALIESEKRYRNLFENVPVGLYRTTEDGRIIDANLTLLKILGYSSLKELKKTNINDFYVSKNAHSLWKNLLKISGTMQNFETSLRRKDGKIIWIRNTASVRKDPAEGKIYFEGVLEDITEQKKAQTELIESEKRFKELADLLPQTIFECDSDFNFTYVNRHATKLTGYSQYEILNGMNVLELFPEQGKKEIIKSLNQVLQAKESETQEFIARRKNGTFFPVLLFMSSIIRQDKSKGIRGVLIDISDRKAIEEALKESEARYRSLVEQSPDAIILHKNGKVVYANTAAVRLYKGENEEALKGLPIMKLVHPDYQELVKNRVKHLRESGEIVPLIYEKHLCLDGSEIDVEVLGTFIHYQGGEANLAIIRDISKRIKAEKALQESEQKLKSILTSMIDMVFLFDPRGRLLFYNARDLDELSVNLDNYKGKTIFKMLPASLKCQLKQTIRELNKGKTVKIDFDFKLKDKNKKWFSANVSPMVIEQQIYGYVAVVRDITERKLAELQISQALKEKETLLQEVHHRVKNNLQSLFYLIEINKAQIDNNSGKEIFSNLQNQLRAMSLVYEQLYHSSNLAQVEMSGYLQNLITNIRHSFSNSAEITLLLKIEKISLSVEKALPCGMIVNELLCNTFKYAFPQGYKGNKNLKIELQNKGNKIHLIVQDSGTGFPFPKDLNSINSMGLKLVYLWATHQLGGKISFDTQNGTKIDIQFPFH
ncbi:MAG: PAS domain S-box protein [Calditrichaeota bacterium]|nr:PAS domain S-box protein [Calditrichota bacterium]